MRPISLAAADRPAGYPAHLERQVELADGRTVFVRPIVPDDAGDLVAALETVDDETLYLRFFTPHPRLGPRQVAYLTEVDYRHRLALVALDEHGTGVAVARTEGAPDSDEAEVAIVVDRAWRRGGLAAALIAVLADAAREAGTARLVAHYLADNLPAARLLAATGFGSPSLVDGVETVTRDLRSPDPGID